MISEKQCVDCFRSVKSDEIGLRTGNGTASTGVAIALAHWGAKKELAEIDSKYQAKIAEKELFLKDQIRKAQTEGKVDDVDSLQKQLVLEIRRLQEECEAKKEKLRASFAKL